MTRKTSHDLGYKELLSHPELVQQLLENFVDLPFVKDIDFTTLERVDKSFVTRSSKRRESDLIWKVQFMGKEAYIYLLMEFQSKNDHWMALRILRYICEFYSDLTKNFKAPRKKLPAVFPIMLYNGEARWTAPKSLAGLIDASGIDAAYIPQFSYFSIAENEFSEETLLAMKNAVAAIFYAENSDKQHLTEYFITVVDLLRNEKPQIISAIERWLLSFVKSDDMQDLVLENFADIKESGNMLATTVKKFAEMNRLEGVEQGLEKGLELIVKNMKARGKSVYEIAESTGLEYAVVEKLYQ